MMFIVIFVNSCEYFMFFSQMPLKKSHVGLKCIGRFLFLILWYVYMSVLLIVRFVDYSLHFCWALLVLVWHKNIVYWINTCYWLLLIWIEYMSLSDFNPLLSLGWFGHTFVWPTILYWLSRVWGQHPQPSLALLYIC